MSSPNDHQPALTRLGDFEILRELGRGGMGVVYEARQVSLNRRVALKVLGGGLGLTPKAVGRFQREAEAAAKLHHTNIVPVYATGEQDGTHFYAMELIDGPSLDLVIRQLRQGTNPAAPTSPDALAPELARTGPFLDGPAPTAAAGLNSSTLGSGGGYFDAVARLIADVADALEHAHQQGVLHRDIKPSNLLLSSAGRLSVNDFGLARMLEQPGMTMTGEFVGTPAYMSPEQITAGRVPIDHRTDVYSLGATLYELLTLQPPFPGERRDQVLAQILQKEPTAPRKVNPRVPVDLETICLKALEKDPDRRYQTAGAMAEDLRRYVNRFAILAKRAGPIARLKKWVKRHPALSAALACVVFAVAVAGVFAYQADRAKKGQIAAEEEAARQLRATQSKAALEMAFLRAYSGDFQGAEQAAIEAEGLGASRGQVYTVRGLIANHRAEYPTSIRYLKLALDQEPDNLSAGALLASSYVFGGMWEEHEKLIERLDHLTPKTREDRIFLGLARSYIDPRKGLDTLKGDPTEQTTPLARFVRAQIQADCAMEEGDLELARLAVADANATKETIRPTTCAVLTTSVFAHLIAANLTPGRQGAEYAKWVAAAGTDSARAVRDFPKHPESALSRWYYLDHVEQHTEARDLLAERCKHTDDPGLLALYGLAMFGAGKGPEALGVITQTKKRGAHLDYVRAMLLTDDPKDGRQKARAAYDELNKEYPTGNRPLAHPDILLLLGKLAEARKRFRDLLGDRERLRRLDREWIVVGLEHAIGKITDDELVRQAGKSPRRLSGAHPGIAMIRLAEGRRDLARVHFQKCIDAGVFYSSDYQLSRAFLTRLKNLPGWPKWIPEKK